MPRSVLLSKFFAIQEVVKFRLPVAGSVGAVSSWVNSVFVGAFVVSSAASVSVNSPIVGASVNSSVAGV